MVAGLGIEEEEVVGVLLVPGMAPLQHGVHEGEIGEVVEVDDQGHCTVSFAALVEDLAHVAEEELGLVVVLEADHMDLVAEAVG
jgi:hypothetical protein